MGKSSRRDHAGAGAGATVILSSFPSPSPSSSSSSDFEFTVSLSPSSRRSAAQQCPADELFYKGKLLPLHLSPRISMVRTLLLASSSSSSSDGTTTTASRSSTSSSDCDSSRPSSAADEDLSRVNLNTIPPQSRRNSYFTSFATRFSNVFHKKPTISTSPDSTEIASKKTTKQVIKKYVNKMRPIYEKLSTQKMQTQPQQKKTFSFSIRKERSENVGSMKKEHVYSHNHSFSGNLRFPKRNRCAGSCPSSMRSSPTHSGVLYSKPVDGHGGGGSNGVSTGASSSMEELQSAIQGAIAHCKSTMGQAKIR